MKTFWGLMLIAATIALSGCDDKPDSPPAAKPASATDGYLGTLAKGQEKAVKTIDVTSLNEEVQLFGAQEGRLPTNLDELVAKKYIPLIPHPPAGQKLVYDAAQGKVSVAPE